MFFITLIAKWFSTFTSILHKTNTNNIKNNANVIRCDVFSNNLNKKGASKYNGTNNAIYHIPVCLTQNAKVENSYRLSTKLKSPLIM